MEGFDYAWGFNSKLPKALKAAGASFVVRYLGTSSKCLTVSEVTALHAAGLSIAAVYETTGATWRGGKGAGFKDGLAARTAAEKVGMPTNAPIFFAIDEDTTNYPTVNDYLAGCAAACAPYPARLYAGIGPVGHAPGDGHWQTYAWSGSSVAHNASLYQYHNGVTVGGVSADRDRTVGSLLAARSGWLVYGAPAPAVPVPPKVVAVVSRDKYRARGNASPHAAAAVRYEKAEQHVGRPAWKDLCASLVRNAYGISASAWGPRHRTAAAAYYMVASKDIHTWYNAPVGVVHYWTGGSSGAGHVAISDGQGNCWTNDFGPNGYIGDGRVRLVPLSAISKHAPSLKYRGWGETYLGVRVYS